MPRFFLIYAGLVAAMVLLLEGCATPKEAVKHHYHSRESDAAAAQAQVDRRLQEMHTVAVQDLYSATTSQQSVQDTQEQQKERVTETITTWVDSLGRQVRQEQRTTERDISRRESQREQRMRDEYEQRLRSMTDSLDAAWTENFSRFQAHWDARDSTSTAERPVSEDNRPWWRRWRDAALWTLLGAVAVIVALAARKCVRRIKHK